MTTQIGERGGQPGNRNAVRAKLYRDALKRALARKGDGEIEKGLNKVADRLVAEALKGEGWAIREIGDRLDGRVPQAVEMTGEGGGEIVVRDASTTMGIARRVAFVLARGAIAAAADKAKNETAGGVSPAGDEGGQPA